MFSDLSPFNKKYLLWNKKINIYIAFLNDDERYFIESDHFYRKFTSENVNTAWTKKAYFKIRNDQGEYDINLFCQQVSSLLNSFPMWNLQIKCEGKKITKILLIDP